MQVEKVWQNITMSLLVTGTEDPEELTALETVVLSVGPDRKIAGTEYRISGDAWFDTKEWSGLRKALKTVTEALTADLDGLAEYHGRYRLDLLGSRLTMLACKAGISGSDLRVSIVKSTGEIRAY